MPLAMQRIAYTEQFPCITTFKSPLSVYERYVAAIPRSPPSCMMSCDMRVAMAGGSQGSCARVYGEEVDRGNTDCWRERMQVTRSTYEKEER